MVEGKGYLSAAQGPSRAHMHLEIDCSAIMPLLWHMFMAFLLMTILETLHEMHTTLMALHATDGPILKERASAPS